MKLILHITIFNLIAVSLAGSVRACGAILAYFESPRAEFEDGTIRLLDVGRRLTVRFSPAPGIMQYMVWSPDGNHLALVTDYGRDHDVYIAGRSGGGLRNLSNTPTLSEANLIWSPDGRALTYTAYGDGASRLIIHELEAGQGRQLSLEWDYFGYAWLENGDKLLAYRSVSRDLDMSLALIDVATEAVREVGEFTYYTHSSIAADGRIAIADQRENIGAILVVDPVSGERLFVSVPNGYSLDPQWSPDGRSLAFVSAFANNQDIFLFDVATREVRNLTNSTFTEYMPRWSPDSRRLAFISNQELYAMDIANGTRRKLPTDFYLTPASTNDVSWSPDGHWLFYRPDPATPRLTTIIDVYAAQQHPIQVPNGVRPVWQPVCAFSSD